VAARFQINVKRCTSREFARSLKRKDLGMLNAVISVKAFADYDAVSDQNGANHGIWAGERYSTRG
jgi:hypothetical protein